MTTNRVSTSRMGRVFFGLLGAVGSVACAGSMLLAAVGVGVAAGATGMAAMSGTAVARPDGLLGVLLDVGPWLQLVSTALVVLAFALSRRPVSALPALLAGILLQVGMYNQPSLVVMYLSIAIGFAFWLALYGWGRASA